MSTFVETAIAPGAHIGHDVRIGHGTRVHASAVIEDGCRIGDFCIIGHPGGAAAAPPVRIGCGSAVRSHSVVYAGTGHRVLIREGTSVVADCVEAHGGTADRRGMRRASSSPRARS